MIRGSDHVPDSLREAVERCLHDMQQPTEVKLRLELADDGEHLMFWESDGTGSGFYLLDDQAGAELVVRLADFLQEQLFPESREAWGEARPACPGHQHPATPTVLEGEAWWVCPDTNRRLFVIGAYRQSEGPL